MKNKLLYLVIFIVSICSLFIWFNSDSSIVGSEDELVNELEMKNVSGSFIYTEMNFGNGQVFRPGILNKSATQGFFPEIENDKNISIYWVDMIDGVKTPLNWTYIVNFEFKGQNFKDVHSVCAIYRGDLKWELVIKGKKNSKVIKKSVGKRLLKNISRF